MSHSGSFLTVFVKFTLAMEVYWAISLKGPFIHSWTHLMPCVVVYYKFRLVRRATLKTGCVVQYILQILETSINKDGSQITNKLPTVSPIQPHPHIYHLNHSRFAQMQCHLLERGRWERFITQTNANTHCVWFLPHNFLSTGSWGHLGEDEYAYVQLKVWRDVSLTPNHFICPICRGCGRTREHSTYRVSTLRVHGHRRDAGYRFDGQCADPPYSCVPPPPGDRAPDRAREPGSVLSEPQKAVSASDEGGLPKTDTLTLGLDFPPRIPWRPTLLLSGSQSDRSGEQKEQGIQQLSPVLSFCKCPQQATKTNTYLHSSLPTL